MAKGQSIRGLRQSLEFQRQLQSVYVIGSGASMDWFDRGFFYGKITITVNEAFRDWPATYALMHHHNRVQEAIDRGLIVVTSEHDCGFHHLPVADFQGAYFTYRTRLNRMEPMLDMSALERGADDELIISACTTAEAIHFAYFIGARSIVLCGVDGGAVDGRLNYKGYNGGGEWPGHGGGPDGGTNPDHLRATRGILLAVVEAIRARGVGVYSLSPWVGFDMEGHKFTPMHAELTSE